MLKKFADEQAKKYVNDYQKYARVHKVNSYRVLNYAEIKEAKAYIVKNIMVGHKHDRKESDVGKSAKPPPKRSRSRKLNYHDAEDVSDAESVDENMSPSEIKRERLRKANPDIRGEYTHLLRMRTAQKDFSQPKMIMHFQDLLRRS